jgi:hypothetical protein
MAAIEGTARVDAGGVVAARAARRAAFDARPGWRLVIEAASGKPLWPQGFDPLNVERVEGGLVHTRFLELGNESGRIRVLDEERADLETFTEAAGEHPLFGGVRRLTVAGIEALHLDETNGGVALERPGLSLELRNVHVHSTGTTVVIRIRDDPHR